MNSYVTSIVAYGRKHQKSNEQITIVETDDGIDVITTIDHGVEVQTNRNQLFPNL